jgi:hypothetical protein
VREGSIEGSVISDSVNSVTKMAKAIRIESATGATWLVIDTPGYGDTDGPIDKIVNAVSIALVVKTCSSLRILMLLNQSDIVAARMSAFVELSSIIANQFCDFESAASSVAIWVNKRPTDNEQEEERLKRMIKKAAKEIQKTEDQDAQKSLQWLLGLLVKRIAAKDAFRILRYKMQEVPEDGTPPRPIAPRLTHS